MGKKELLLSMKKFLQEQGMKQADLASAIGVGQNIISDMLNGKRRPERLVDFVDDRYGTHYATSLALNSDVSIETDPMTEPTPVTENGNGIRFYRQTDGTLLLEAPLVSRNALGSPGDDFASYTQDRDDLRHELFSVDAIHRGMYLSFAVDGDSMDDGTETGFRRGDVVLVREVGRNLWLPKLHYRSWPFWVVVFGNNVRLKQIVAQDEEKGTITLHSLNSSPEYTDFTLRLDDVTRLFNVVMKKPRQVRYGGM